MTEPKKPGYHLRDIPKGVLGEVSKIREELEELEDAWDQDVKILQLVELSDLLGAVTAFLEKHHPGTQICDLLDMRDVTRRAFENGHRTTVEEPPTETEVKGPAKKPEGFHKIWIPDLRMQTPMPPPEAP